MAAGLIAVIALSISSWTEASGSNSLSIDVGDVTGNTEATLGTLNSAFSLCGSGTYTLDVVMEGFTDVVAAQFTLNYPAGSVTAHSVQVFDGRIDLSGNGSAGAEDAGFFFRNPTGIQVIAGRLDMVAPAGIGPEDDGFADGHQVIDGEMDMDNDLAITTFDDGATNETLLNNESPNALDGGVIDVSASDSVPDTDGTHTIVISNDLAAGSGGATGSGMLVRLTLTAPAAAGAYPLTLTSTTVNDHTASEITHHVHNATLTVISADVADADSDTYQNGLECHVGTTPGQACSATVAANDEDPDARPTDFNDDRSVSGADLSAIAADIGKTVPPAPVRKDIAPDPAGDNAISGADLSRVAAAIGTSC